jgi:hypothetical protein
MPDVDVKNRHPAFFFFATLQRWGVAFSGVRYDEPAFPTSQSAFVRLLSRSINGTPYEFTVPRSSARLSVLFFVSRLRRRFISHEIEIRRVGI